MTKCIIFDTPEGVTRIRPNYRQRLVIVEPARTVTMEDGGKVKIPAVVFPLEQVSRSIGLDDPAIKWAETEDEFLHRVMSENIRKAKHPIGNVGEREDRARIGQPANPHWTEDVPYKFVDASDVPEDRTRWADLIKKGDPELRSHAQRRGAKP